MSATPGDPTSPSPPPSAPPPPPPPPRPPPPPPPGPPPPPRAAGRAVAVVGQVDAEVAAVGDRAARGYGHRAGVAARRPRVGHAVPHEARPQLGELVGGVLAGEHGEHGLEGVAAQLGVVLGPSRQGVELIDGPRAVGGGA